MKRFLVIVIVLILTSFHSVGQSTVDKVVNAVEQTLNDTAVIPIGIAPMNAPPIMANKWNQSHTKNPHD